MRIRVCSKSAPRMRKLDSQTLTQDPLRRGCCVHGQTLARHIFVRSLAACDTTQHCGCAVSLPSQVPCGKAAAFLADPLLCSAACEGACPASHPCSSSCRACMSLSIDTHPGPLIKGERVGGCVHWGSAQEGARATSSFQKPVCVSFPFRHQAPCIPGALESHVAAKVHD